MLDLEVPKSSSEGFQVAETATGDEDPYQNPSRTGLGWVEGQDESN